MKKRMPYENPELFIWVNCLQEDVITSSLDNGGDNGDLSESEWGDF